jgi:hypothetical protein
MNEFYYNERVIPNEALRKLLEKPLVSKIKTDILNEDLVIDLELSEDTGQVTLEAASEEKKDTSWKDLKQKILRDAEDSITQDSDSESNNSQRNSYNSSPDFESCLGAISNASSQVSEASSRMGSEILSSTENDPKEAPVIERHAAIDADSFYLKLTAALFGVMTLGLLLGLVLGVLIIRVL